MPAALSRWASKAVVVVLPLVPVTASQACGDKRKAYSHSPTSSALAAWALL